MSPGEKNTKGLFYYKNIKVSKHPQCRKAAGDGDQLECCLQGLNDRKGSPGWQREEYWKGH